MKNNDRRIPFALPDIGDEETARVLEVMESGWLTTGKFCQKFEKDFEQYIGGGVKAIAVNSATAGLICALRALNISEGDEVIVPVMTFSATAMAVVHVGATPVFVDVAYSTMNMEAEAVEKAITNKTKAIMPVHIAGRPVDMNPIFALAKKFNLKVIEDAAHCIPTAYGGVRIGALESDATVFSFYATKTITTGEGGMIVTRDPIIAQRCSVLRLHGMSSDGFDRYIAPKPKWHYDIVDSGYKYNLTDLAAAIGIEQLAKADRFHSRRSAIANSYLTNFAVLPIDLPRDCFDEGDVHSWHLFIIRLKEGFKTGRTEIINALFSLGIGCSVHYIPLCEMSFWRNRYGLRTEDFPVVNGMWNRIISLPLYSKMSDDDVDYVIKSVKHVFSRYE